MSSIYDLFYEFGQAALRQYLAYREGLGDVGLGASWSSLLEGSRAPSSGGPSDARVQREELIDEWLERPSEATLPLAELAVLFGLSPLDVQLLLVATAPVLDRRFRQAVGALSGRKDDRLPVDLAADLVALGDRAMFRRAISRFHHTQPLVRHRLIVLDEREAPLNLSHPPMVVADRVLVYLGLLDVKTRSVSQPLATVCERLEEAVTFEHVGLPEATERALQEAALHRRLPLLLEGPGEHSRLRVAQALAGVMGRSLLRVDLVYLLDQPLEILEMRLVEIFREARLGGDLVYLAGQSLPEHLGAPSQALLARALVGEAAVLSVSECPPWASALVSSWPQLTVPLPSPERRVALWEAALCNERHRPTLETLTVIARRFRLTAAQIDEAAMEARRRARVMARGHVTALELDAACRMQLSHQLSDLAQPIPPTPFSPADLILPEGETARFLELLDFAHSQGELMEGWGFGKRMPYGRGLSVLFHGPPGTGKTMAATIMAQQLGLDLFRVELSRLVSRYVGETEKNLARIFDEAERGRVLLLFDEADSLFTKRTDVKSSNDRYANLEVAYLLQRMESFEGVSVLTTNVEQHIDEAFKRRLRTKIHFPMPNAGTRTELWRRQVPPEAPQRPDIAFEHLGEHYELSGGVIKSAVLRAAFYAHREGVPIGLAHLVQAAVAECREGGVLVSDRHPRALELALAHERQSLVRA